uniref:MACPF domain-containing protein n=1 Tax=Pyxicephalus adspersus TaxID=30357 RepID=A0AAV3A6Y0_PYXAD|nr:TPA: hypothetical protein GDO54_014871 [Pyxicephalus adspersus]
MLTFFGFLILHRSICTTPPILTYSCVTGTEAQCKTAKFLPGHTLLVDKTCTLCNNPYAKNALQKLPMALVDWRPESSCSRQIVSSVSESKVSLAKEATSSVQNDWKVGLDVTVKMVKAKTSVAGSHSDMAKFSDNKSLNDKYSYLSHKLQCTYYSFSLSSDPPLTPHFTKALKNLPKSYNVSTKAAYRLIIEKFGTHFITQAKVDEVKDCLNAEAEIAASTIDKEGKLISTIDHCKQKANKANYGDSFHQTLKERIWEVKGGKATFDLLSAVQGKKEVFENWMESLKTDPGLVSYSLEPIHNLVRLKGPQKENLKLAVETYIKDMAVRENCSCSAPSFTSPVEDCPCICPATQYTDSNCCPSQRGIGKLHITIKSATGLRGDRFSKTDGYVKFGFDSDNRATRTIWNNNHPPKTYTIEVWDEDNKYDYDLLGKCEQPLISGKWSETCYLKHGSLSYSISVICSSYLHGPYCKDYSPVPPK